MMPGAQPILVLREGTRQGEGKSEQIQNIEAAVAIANLIRSTLGPKGMDVMLVDPEGDTIISNDGVTILKESDIVHPCGKMLVDAAKTQDDECGDGTTTAVILAGELLKQAKTLIEENIHPTVIIDGYQQALRKSLEILDIISFVPDDSFTYQMIAETSMTGKATEDSKTDLSGIVVSAVLAVQKEGKIDLDNIRIIKLKGKGVSETELINGLVMGRDRDVAHHVERCNRAMPKSVVDPHVVLMNCDLSPKEIKDINLNISDLDQLDQLVERDDKQVSNIVDKIKASGCTVLFCQKGIDDDLASQLAEWNILAYRRITEDNMDLLHKITGSMIHNKITDLETGTKINGKIYEDKIDEETFVHITNPDCQDVQTIIIRGATDHVVDEIERSVHDAISTVSVAFEDHTILAGGGSSFIEVQKGVLDDRNLYGNRTGLAIEAFARAMDVVPQTLAENAGLDSIDTKENIKKAHADGHKYHGVNVASGLIEDMRALQVLEPERVVRQALISAVETTQMILRIKEVIVGKGMDMPKEV